VASSKADFIEAGLSGEHFKVGHVFLCVMPGVAHAVLSLLGSPKVFFNGHQESSRVLNVDILAKVNHGLIGCPDLSHSSTHE